MGWDINYETCFVVIFYKLNRTFASLVIAPHLFTVAEIEMTSCVGKIWYNFKKIIKEKYNRLSLVMQCYKHKVLIWYTIFVMTSESK